VSLIGFIRSTTPTLLSDELRGAAEVAESLAVDLGNALDNNPFIGEEWMAVAGEFREMARRLEIRLQSIFKGG